MPHLEPTYLRYIYDGLIKGSIHPENAAELPDGLIGMYDEAFDERTSVVERQKLLQRFAIWALLKKEVSAAFVAEILGETEDEIQEFISTYSAWFNSPESGKYQLYHERLKVYLLQKLSEGEVHTLHEKLIARLENAIEAQKADEFEWYGLEFLTSHLSIAAMLNGDGKKLIDLAYSQTHWQRQLKISKGYSWTKNSIQEVMAWASKYNDDEVIECGLQMVVLHHQEQNAAPQIVAMIAEGDFDAALKRIEQFGGNDKEGLQRKFILYMLCLMELTFLDSIDNPYRKEGVAKLLKHFDEQLPVDHSVLNWGDFFSSKIVFQISKWLTTLNLEYRLLFNRTHCIDLQWVRDYNFISLGELLFLLELNSELPDSKLGAELWGINTNNQKSKSFNEFLLLNRLIANGGLQSLENIPSSFLGEDLDKLKFELVISLYKVGRIDEALSILVDFTDQNLKNDCILTIIENIDSTVWSTQSEIFSNEANYRFLKFQIYFHSITVNDSHEKVLGMLPHFYALQSKLYLPIEYARSNFLLMKLFLSIDDYASAEAQIEEIFTKQKLINNGEIGIPTSIDNQLIYLLLELICTYGKLIGEERSILLFEKLHKAIRRKIHQSDLVQTVVIHLLDSIQTYYLQLDKINEYSALLDKSMTDSGVKTEEFKEIYCNWFILLSRKYSIEHLEVEILKQIDRDFKIEILLSLSSYFQEQNNHTNTERILKIAISEINAQNFENNQTGNFMIKAMGYALIEKEMRYLNKCLEIAYQLNENDYVVEILNKYFYKDQKINPLEKIQYLESAVKILKAKNDLHKMYVVQYILMVSFTSGYSFLERVKINCILAELYHKKEDFETAKKFIVESLNEFKKNINQEEKRVKHSNLLSCWDKLITSAKNINEELLVEDLLLFSSFLLDVKKLDSSSIEAYLECISNQSHFLNQIDIDIHLKQVIDFNLKTKEDAIILNELHHYYFKQGNHVVAGTIVENTINRFGLEVITLDNFEVGLYLLTMYRRTSQIIEGQNLIKQLFDAILDLKISEKGVFELLNYIKKYFSDNYYKIGLEVLETNFKALEKTTPRDFLMNKDFELAFYCCELLKIRGALLDARAYLNEFQKIVSMVSRISDNLLFKSAYSSLIVLQNSNECFNEVINLVRSRKSSVTEEKKAHHTLIQNLIKKDDKERLIYHIEHFLNKQSDWDLIATISHYLFINSEMKRINLILKNYVLPANHSKIWYQIGFQCSIESNVIEAINLGESIRTISNKKSFFLGIIENPDIDISDSTIYKMVCFVGDLGMVERLTKKYVFQKVLFEKNDSKFINGKYKFIDLEWVQKIKTHLPS
jgi:hypothetical protein